MKGRKWLYLGVISLVWGSSFILMKKALIGLAPFQIGAMRILISGVLLFVVAFDKIIKIEKRHWLPIAQVAFIASFFPAFFFAFVIDEIDSSVSAVLSSLTPMITMILGALFFGFAYQKKQIIGIFVGLLGTLLLILSGVENNPDQNYFYTLLILLSSIGYALSLNIIKSKLQDANAMAITAGGFLLLFPFAFLVLLFSGFEELNFSREIVQHSLGYVFLLSLLGTAFAKVLFNKLVQISTPVFSSSVTYLITVVAVSWGFIDGERLSFYQIVAISVVFTGVYLVNKKKRDT
jgi:drug/metabolite transporter (DMT)-like permease